MYIRFAAMIATSTIVMFGLMYLNTFQFAHVTYSETRTYMALVMGAAMAMIMLGFMTHMLKNWRVNIGIILGSVLVFTIALWLVRSQSTVGDVSYMSAMIPHHSIAILTSERANITDPRARELADEIIAAQRREIAVMKALISDIRTNGKQRAGNSNEAGRSVNEMLLGSEVPPPDPSSVVVPEGFRVEVAIKGLNYPTSVEFDDRGAMYVAEAGYSYGDPSAEPRILRVMADGKIETIIEGQPLVGPVNDLLWYAGKMFVSHRGKISILDDQGQVRDLVTGLPSEGDHQNNQMTVGPDGKIYFGQGTATNSAVVGLDNYKMGWLPDHPKFHDIPAQDLKLVGRTFETADPIDGGELEDETSAFHPFGKTATEDAVVQGQTKASGTILRMNADGTELEVYAWGLRNPFGAMWSADKQLYVTENGFDVRGSRPIANDKEDIYKIEQDGWYGWPDFAMGLPVTESRFKPDGKSQPKFLMEEHPPLEQPWMNFPKHSAIAKLEFARTEEFGEGQMFVAFFGHMVPMTGEAPEQHGGHRVVRIDPATKTHETFFGKRHGHDGKQGHSSGDSTDEHNGAPKHADSSQHEGANGHGESMSAGPRRLLDVRFNPSGESLYIADFGAMTVKDKPLPVPGTGVIWRVVANGKQPVGPPANLSVPK